MEFTDVLGYDTKGRLDVSDASCHHDPHRSIVKILLHGNEGLNGYYRQYKNIPVALYSFTKSIEKKLQFDVFTIVPN